MHLNRSASAAIDSAMSEWRPVVKIDGKHFTPEQLLDFHRAHFGDARMEGENTPSGNGDAGGQGGDEPPAGGAPADPPPAGGEADKGFPADTPLSEMSAEQQAAYWKDKARKHEQRANSRVDYDDLKSKADRLEQLERENESEKDKAVREAREKAATDTRAEIEAQTVQAMARMALRSRGVKDEGIASFVTETNLSAFVSDDGQVDDERLLARVDRYAGTAGGQQRWPGTGQDRRGGATRESGSDLYDRLHGSKK